ncbi:site-specific DNA-methyltransferase [Corynebacterium diphtheriae]|uniref:site-specific DNA-methyltransferase n=2 Tax=Corynebacterium diphtheriae TaxID=1717 RepID=UPI0013C8F6F3|nr:site-specific DNA-methyltransferase [Corynebacterium diphtheriae]CAB0567034.1 site-specific DNA-methyltransferase [Corynebacterium diphtheriae]CAB0705987.1 site-specific DNA-methyltransferase [Corynebacterium diphtheriae]CAB0971632.1 site-specific DNA-methyltransferase [Corynebacterium diphtheriae]
MSEERDMINEVPGSSPEFRTELAEQLAELVPEAVADGKIDVEKLKELLGGDVADTSERFGLFWPGKKRAMRAAQTPTTATLRPDKENSKDWDTTKNVFIEGDNLEVLKILQKHYHGKIKMIYIDPPYNTGKDFVYHDNYKEGLETYLEWTKQVNEDGKKISTNADADGRYHSNWLSMLYPRLKLARNLLTEDGVVFVSIDDNELNTLISIGREIFGEQNYVGTLSWSKKRKGSFLSKKIVSMHEYVVCFSRLPDFQLVGGKADTKESQPLVKRTNAISKLTFPANSVQTKLPDGLLRSGIYGEGSSAVELLGEVAIKNGVMANEFSLQGPFVWSQETLDAQIRQGARIIINTEKLQPRVFKAKSDDNLKGLSSIINGLEIGATNEDAYEYSKSLFEVENVLDYPKPVNLLIHLIRAATFKNKDAIIMDFFAGSGTTADALMRLNAIDGGNRKFIAVQLPEPVGEKSAARIAGFETIADIARERINRAGVRIINEHPVNSTCDADTGFRSYKLADTNFTKWRSDSDTDATQLEQHLLDLRESADDDATPDDLLTEILLKQGHSLVEQIRDRDIDGLPYKAVVRVDDEDGEEDTLVLAYLDEHTKPTLAQLRAALEVKPAQFIMLEDAFQGDDELKTNLAQICKTNGIELWTA